MFLTAVDLLARLSGWPDHKLNRWIVRLFSDGQAEPDCPWPGDDSSRRLQLLCSYPVPQGTNKAGQRRAEKLILTQRRLQDEVEKLCADYGRRYTARCRLELLAFTLGTRNRVAARSFCAKLRDFTLPLEEYGGEYVWVEAHRVVAELLPDQWSLVKRWVARDAGVSDVGYGLRKTPEGAWHRLQIALSAVAVWAQLGPIGSYSYLVRAITRLLVHPLPEDAEEEGELLEDIERCVSQVIERTEDYRPGYFRDLLNEMFSEDSTGWEPWRELLDRLDMASLLASMPVPPSVGEHWEERVKRLLSVTQYASPDMFPPPFA